MKKEIEWEDIEAFLLKVIHEKPGMETGIQKLDKMLVDAIGQPFLSTFNIARFEAEFNEWIDTIFAEEKLPAHINSIYFGLFTICDERYNNGEEATTVHMTGTSTIPEDDDDWACEDSDSFLSENRYFIFSDFSLLDKQILEIESEVQVEELIFNGLLALLLINNIDKHKHQFLTPKHKKGLNIGFGFDSGDNFVLGKLTSKALA